MPLECWIHSTTRTLSLFTLISRKYDSQIQASLGICGCSFMPILPKLMCTVGFHHSPPLLLSLGFHKVVSLGAFFSLTISNTLMLTDDTNTVHPSACAWLCISVHLNICFLLPFYLSSINFILFPPKLSSINLVHSQLLIWPSW